MSRHFGIYAVFSLLCAALVAIRPLNFLSDDGLFYLVIAQHLANGQGSTFNGLFTTNGYHPLWECIAATLALLVRDKSLLLAGGVLIQLTFNIATIALLLKALRPWIGAPALWAFCAVMLFFFVPFGNLFWSEAPISMLFVALIFHILLSNKPVPYLLLGITLGLAFLSRLDNVFLIGCVVVGLWWRDRDLRLALACVICAVLASAYLMTNLVNFGQLMPISGAIKSAVYRQQYFAGQLGTNGLISLLGAIGLGVTSLWHKSRPFAYRFATMVLASGVILHAFYVWAMTYGDTVWVWYYVQGYLCVALLVAQGVESLSTDVAARLSQIIFIASLTLSVAIVGAKFLINWSWHDPRAVAGHWRNEWLAEIERVLPNDNSVLVVIDLPGLFAYGSSHPVFALDGLTMNFEFERKLAQTGMLAQLKRFGTAYFVGPMLAAGEELRAPFVAQHGIDGGQIVHFFTPLHGVDAGCIKIDNAMLVTERPAPATAIEGNWGLWKLTAQSLQPVTCPPVMQLSRGRFLALIRSGRELTPRSMWSFD